MDPSPTELYLPSSFPYPIKVVSIDASTSSEIERGTRLLSYSFVYLSRTAGAQPETRFGTWDSAIEGTLQSWNVSVGDVISQRKAKEKPVGIVIEPCKHGMQLGGLCVLCGKDMTNTDYIGFSDASRASIQMTHSANGPTVSLEEAQRIEKETAEHLLKSRKLSLIVDLDQTIVHATVDPTVGEWIAEGEAWEAKRAAKASSAEGTEADDEDECNPNWEALKDVKKFRLGPESFGTVPRGKGKAANKGVESEGCMYYIKPRPGWKEFLKEVSTKYEMHVYTMGTRAYAEEVCAAIDPDGTAFSGRLLSRDESGSLTQKSLQRLFPCDTSMVVIIDDRADVWEWSPNLVKVIPYDFFVGIGDINSTFLPKIEPLTASTPPPSTPTTSSSDSSSSLAVPSGDVERTQLEANAKLTENSLALEAQVEARPLAKKQEELQGAPAAENSSNPDETPVKQDDQLPAATKEKEEAKSTTPTKTPRKALLRNDDAELDRVYKLLSDIHQQFFEVYDAHSSQPDSKVRKKNKGLEKNPWDVTRIIPSIRSEVFKGVNLLFSSVIPLDTRPESTEIWRMAVMFGAKCSVELASDITHVVAAKRGTVKVDMARKRGGIKIVWLAWFTDSVALWQRQDETPYLLDDPPAAGPSTSPLSFQQMSSDPELDEEEEWELEAASGPGPGSATTASTAFEASQINWDDINDEVEAAMMESDDDDDDDMSEVNIGGRNGSTEIQSANASEDEWTDESNSVISSANNTPKKKRKRLRSLTPSEAGINGGDNDTLRSPLSKRKKLAADRSGYSKLKEAISAEDMRSDAGSVKAQSDDGSSDERATPTKATKENNNDEGDDEEGEEGEADDDDFLAREMEEEWG
ncbi:CTD phosphatase Fcp1 [Stygiomarasmius scandens]|uniref:RNA polymerase II subunit A C-terminal domain phosphatase n=1 Tax=Marasmiellus scandens TaxID=2682957 RepID=A0ABR1JUX5_9AGAR